MEIANALEAEPVTKRQAVLLGLEELHNPHEDGDRPEVYRLLYEVTRDL
jgi:hypothetical protein